MIFIVIILILIIFFLSWNQIRMNKKIKELQHRVPILESVNESDETNLTLFWMRFPFYCCLAFVLVLIFLMFISIPGWYTFSTLQLLSLTLSSLFFVYSDLCLVGLNMNTRGLAPKWIEIMYRKTSRSAYKRFFWFAFISFITSFILQQYEPIILKEIMELYNTSFSLIALSCVIFLYGLRSMEELSKNITNKN